jgi:hypothetical protein
MSVSCSISGGTALSGSDGALLLLLLAPAPEETEAGDRPMKRRLGGTPAGAEAGTDAILRGVRLAALLCAALPVGIQNTEMWMDWVSGREKKDKMVTERRSAFLDEDHRHHQSNQQAWQNTTRARCST